ncbi:hypothetical protein KZ829_32535 [Actinoplanes hulinensis]|uniref:LPXTG cell wall anchor domain-containing protein n=1 Tax=Actinoplanes hulinensis TaxID=1144547 RepID=A0ABS7BC37_9ACTN|nr:hypothetical protein [Actinoplanes hulinensis]MBW6438462.1 hypothetical protein [Actinoplanes hulinensis]
MVNNETERPRLKGWLAMSLGLVAIVLGGVWTLQGLDVLPYSAMSGQTVWAVVGGGLIMAGLLLIAVGMRRRSSAQKPVP